MRQTSTGRRVGVAVGSVACVVAAVWAATPMAQAADGDSVVARGSLRLAPNFGVLNIDAKASTTAGKTEGSYTATVTAGTAPLPLQVRGPITCLDVTGDTASFVYPIQGSTPDVLPGALRGAVAIQITLTKGGQGQPDRVGVFGPVPRQALSTCAPRPTQFDFVGTLDIHAG
ncbi:hypothetical protein [Williamsia sterculiae]|uniref:MspA protein n=1 Tax=Williamsia sterculiae TaxID=1344003 RepID=A0A1N7FIN5_9NOCA|nr:hypothetical protein [Williamsia sterculiae]SIS00209.1 hypothetical protein SAMN05445060_2105 [Williamsia sterculiae]